MGREKKISDWKKSGRDKKRGKVVRYKRGKGRGGNGV